MITTRELCGAVARTAPLRASMLCRIRRVCGAMTALAPHHCLRQITWPDFCGATSPIAPHIHRWRHTAEPRMWSHPRESATHSPRAAQHSAAADQNSRAAAQDSCAAAQDFAKTASDSRNNHHAFEGRGALNGNRDTAETPISTGKPREDQIRAKRGHPEDVCDILAQVADAPPLPGDEV